MKRTHPAARGFTLAELLVSVAVGAIIVALTTQVLVGIDRDQAHRKFVVTVQETARAGMGWLEQDLRAASLGTGTGIVWTVSGAAVVKRPSVQIFRNLPGGGFLADVKPGSSAILVVQALTDPPPVASQLDQLTSTAVINLTAAPSKTISRGTPVLLGDYTQASWGIASSDVTGNTLSLTDTTYNVFPGNQIQLLPAGSSVRAARARLYYVDASDELVRLTLTVPRAPASAAEIATREVLGTGFENLQIECQLDPAQLGSVPSCPASLSTAESISTESEAAFGDFAAGQGPVFTADGSNGVGRLRTVLASAVVRSRRPLANGTGDPPIALKSCPGGTCVNVTLPVGGASNTEQYIRRAYALTAAVRNTSLGNF